VSSQSCAVRVISFTSSASVRIYSASANSNTYVNSGQTAKLISVNFAASNGDAYIKMMGLNFSSPGDKQKFTNFRATSESSGQFSQTTKPGTIAPDYAIEFIPTSPIVIASGTTLTINFYAEVISTAPTSTVNVTYSAYDITGASGSSINPNVTADYNINSNIVISGSSLDPHLTVTSPRQGDAWQMGTTHTISWSAANLFSSSTVNISLSPYYACLYSQPSCLMPQPGSYVIATNVANTGSYSWTIPASLSTKYQSDSIITITAGNAGATSGVFKIASGVDATTIQSTLSNATGKINQYFTSALKSTGGSGNYSYKVTSGALPQGLSLQTMVSDCSYPTLSSFAPCGGAYTSITGTPVYSGPSTFTITATDSQGRQGGTSFTIVISPSNSPNTILELTQLPLDSSSSVLVPNKANQKVLAFRIANKTGSDVQMNHFEVNPAGVVNTARASDITKIYWYSNGTQLGSASFNESNDGSLNPAYIGSLSGPGLLTVPANGSVDVTITADVSANAVVGHVFAPYAYDYTQNYVGAPVPPGIIAVQLIGSKITIGGETSSQIFVFTESDLKAKVGEDFGAIFAAKGGTVPYTYAVTSGSLPPGLRFGPFICPSGGASGACAYAVKGTPTQQGDYNFTLTATDSQGKTASNTFTLSVASGESAIAHVPGTNINSNGKIYFIDSAGRRRAYPSAAVFLSYGFNSFSSVQAANTADMALSEGNIIPPQDGKLFYPPSGPDRGTVFLITHGQKAGFANLSAFLGSGYKFTRIISADLSLLSSTASINNSNEAHRYGALINNNGTVQYIGNNGLVGIPSQEIFYSWGYSFEDVVPANDADKALPVTGILQARQQGELTPSLVEKLPTPESEAINTLDYFVSNKGLTGTHDQSQTIKGDHAYFTKWSPNVFEVYRWDSSYIYHQEDHGDSDSSQAYHFEPGLWMKRQMKVGEKIDQTNTSATYYVPSTCAIKIANAPAYYINTLEAHLPNYDLGGDVGKQDVIVLAYNYDPSLRYLEKFYYAKGWGWVKWEYYVDGQLQSTSIFNKIAASVTPPNYSAQCTERSSTALVAPSISPKSGSFAVTQLITLTTPSTGAIIRYTTDGAEPTVGSSVYTAPFGISATAIVKAKTFASTQDTVGSNTSAAVFFNTAQQYLVPQFPADASGVVTHMYRHVLDRTTAIDQAGFDFWLGQVTKQSASTESLSLLFKDFYNLDPAGEFMHNHPNITDVDFVTHLFMNAYFRPPDAGGMGFWLDKLASGNSRQSVRDAFLDPNGAEFKAVLNKILALPKH
jgi:hypothetical protein